MPILPFRSGSTGAPNAAIGRVLEGYSIEVMPRTAAKIEDFHALLPQGTRVYIAHIEGTPIDDMIATAKRLNSDGFAVMPHFPARIIKDEAEFRTWVSRYRDEAGVSEALVLGGSPTRPVGAFDSSRQLLDTGAFQEAGYTRLHVAGHPEGNRDIDPDGGSSIVDEALRWKAAWARTNGIEMAIVTQFAFDGDGVVAWAKRLRSAGIELPIHLGVAGPAKLQTLIKFAIACGVGPSLSVLQKRARDISKLVMPFEPDALLEDVADASNESGAPLFERMHLFPLGGIATSANYAARYGITVENTAVTTGAI
ncbi:MAG: methylenetetrahydrofolate reductase [Boseongicola sp.]|nr:methylenetetrahydrofolate reductase [Boseongicola sp.]